MTFKPAFLIPVYNHKDVLEHILSKLQPFGIPCLMVNDGSELACRDEMERLAHIYDWVSVHHLQQNQGKGGAVMAGVELLNRQGYSHAFQLDADGQHDLAQIKLFLDTAKERQNALVLGYSVYDDSVPKSRLYGRYITHFWVWVETLSFKIKDTMCGFRVYPVAATQAVISRTAMGKRMEFDVEVVVRLHWAGVESINLPVDVSYPMDGISHFDVFNDNVRISKTHTKLFFGMLLRLPALLFRGLYRIRQAV
ncbi:MAG: glycosyltransferase family 2 protein [Pseudomonadales bacterium]|nr:glycosyltransferase family 2 protein [Pseudomonadales bacterium]